MEAIFTLYFLHHVGPAIKEDPFGTLTVIIFGIVTYVGYEIYKDYSEKKDLKKYMENLRKRVDK